MLHFWQMTCIKYLAKKAKDLKYKEIRVHCTVIQHVWKLNFVNLEISSDFSKNFGPYRVKSSLFYLSRSRAKKQSLLFGSF